MSRIEVTIPEPRLEQVRQLEKELGLTKSQIVEEAIGLFFKAVLEVKRGLRVGFIAEEGKLVRELTSPALSQVEWATHRETVRLSNRGFDRMQELVSKPRAPAPALRAAIECEPDVGPAAVGRGARASSAARVLHAHPRSR